jgi:hypothetical protein
MTCEKNSAHSMSLKTLSELV